jgi:hypothetical protein
MAGVIMGMGGQAISVSCLGSRQLKVLAVIVGGCTRKGHLDRFIHTLPLFCAGKVILEAYFSLSSLECSAKRSVRALIVCISNKSTPTLSNPSFLPCVALGQSLSRLTNLRVRC